VGFNQIILITNNTTDHHHSSNQRDRLKISTIKLLQTTGHHH
jgi:hypothetical protein